MRLSEATLASLPHDIARPGYHRSEVRTGVVHLGIGAFHRAHQAAIFDAALAGGDLRWGVLGVSLRSATVRDQLMPQDGLYSLVEGDGTEDQVRIIGAVQGVLVAPEKPAAVVAALAAPDTHIVTLTITEKGYKVVAGRLDEGDADVAHDIVNPSAPRTAPGFLVAALAARRAAGLPPFTTLSCDNLPNNGALLRDAVLAIANAQDPILADWIAEHAAFPSTMVDRIVPATSDADIASLAQRLGIEDRAMVKTEPFFQWVVEDRFCGARPDFRAPWRADHRKRSAMGGGQASPPQRRAFGDGLCRWPAGALLRSRVCRDASRPSICRCIVGRKRIHAITTTGARCCALSQHADDALR